MRLSRASNHYSRLIALSAAAAFAAVGCNDGTAPKVPSLVEAVATTPSATAGLPLVVAPTFSVKDASGIMLAGVPVTIAVTAGGGSLAGPPTATASDGPTSIGTWTLGKTAGPNTVSVTVGNLQPLLITVNGVAGPPAAVVITSGNSQSALAGTLLPAAVTAQVQDQFGNPVAGSVVNFSIVGGGGTLSASIVTADANGNAAVTWRLGKSAVPQIAAVSSQGFTTNAIASVRSDYSVDLRFFGPTPPAEALAAFTEAAARVSAIIVGDIPDLDIPTVTGNTGLNLNSCGVTGQVLNERVDDLIIYATVVSIDGPGKILASAGPCFVRLASGADCVPPTTPPATCNGFPLVGVMRFDADDIASLVASGRLNGVVLHEMLHVVGIGTNWRARSLLTGAGTLDPRYVGSLGIAGCNEAGGTLVCTTGIPVENTGGAGTADAHWRESVFDTEIMTGFAEGIGVPTPLSNMTIQSLADEGYTVNSAAADPYTIPGLTGLLGLRGNLSASETSPFDIVVQPSFGITRTGSVRKLVVTQ